MARALRSEAEHELGVLLDAELRTRVEQVLGASGESPLPEVVARRLGMSVRTLQRRLGEEGTSFREIRDSVRLSRARRLLTEARLSISEVAERLGFADVSAFDNAFTIEVLPLTGLIRMHAGEYVRDFPDDGDFD